MTAYTRTLAAVAAALLAAGLVLSGPAAAAGIDVATPAGQAIRPGSTVTVTWSGGPPGARVNVELIDVERWAVVGDAGRRGEPNDGSARMPLPRDLACGQRYQFYVETPDKAHYGYGLPVLVDCSTTGVSNRQSEPMPGPVPPFHSGRQRPTDDDPPDSLPRGDRGKPSPSPYPDDGRGSNAPRPINDDPRPGPVPQPGRIVEAGERYCGTIHNETYDVRDTVVMIARAGAGFSGEITVGAKMFGSGPFQGSRAGGACTATTGALAFEGACPTDRFSARYAIRGQQGTFDVSKAACGKSPAPRDPDPQPKPAPVPPPAPRPDRVKADPAPPKPAIPEPLREARWYCGTMTNRTRGITDEIRMSVSGGQRFDGVIFVGPKLSEGSGPFEGTRQGAECRATTGHMNISATCPTDRISGTFIYRGQTGTFEATAAGCKK